jgi:hypothetical protein
MLLRKSGQEERNIAGPSSMVGPEVGESKYFSKLQSKKNEMTVVCAVREQSVVKERKKEEMKIGARSL